MQGMQRSLGDANVGVTLESRDPEDARRLRGLPRRFHDRVPQKGSNMPIMGNVSTGGRPRPPRKRSLSPSTRRSSGLANALFSATQQRVLGLLFGQPNRTFYATEIIHLAGSGSGAVQRELQRLEESGLVVVSRIGNQKHFQANRAAPVFEELCGLVRKTVGLVDPLKTALAPLARRSIFAFVYGSVAKGMERASSDIDVMVVSDVLTLEALFAALKPAEKKLGRPVNPTLLSSDEFTRRRKIGNAFLGRVLAGERIVLLGSDDALGTA